VTAASALTAILISSTPTPWPPTAVTAGEQLVFVVSPFRYNRDVTHPEDPRDPAL
jgi:hypothetical protein